MIGLKIQLRNRVIKLKDIIEGSITGNINSWKINLGKVFSGINRGKPILIKKGLKEIKILNKKIEEMIEELI